MFVMFTDTDCDVTPELAEELGFELIYMPYSIDAVEHMPYEKGKVYDGKEFYNLLRNGAMPQTSALNPYTYRTYFEPFFKKGVDILYVHFSEKMSGTFNQLTVAISELKEEYPNVRFELLDTKAISLGSLGFIFEISKLYKQNKSMDEIIAWGKENYMHFATFFVVEDLDFLKRSGRVSGFASMVGTLVGLRPIIRMDADGTMNVCAKALGRKKAIDMILSYVDKLKHHLEDYQVIVAHADAPEIADEIKRLLSEKYGELNIYTVVANPVIGAHCGPNTFSVSFHSISR